MSKAKWIWYPNDFEIETANKFMTNRYERDVFIPPFWELHSCYKNIKFIKNTELAESQTIHIKAEGKFNVQINGKYLYDFKGEAVLEKGRCEIVVSVYNDRGIPCILVTGKEINSDETWLVTGNDHTYFSAKTDPELMRDDSTPNCVRLAVEEKKPVKVIRSGGRIIYDFGRELFACVRFFGATAGKRPVVYYGESLYEAEDTENCELLSTDLKQVGDTFTTKTAKAFRYVTADDLEFTAVSALFEYLPMKKRSFFKCSDELVNRIYEVAEYTLFLNTREFLIDGIKRDRWIWSGDAYQSYLMHYYSYFDKEVVKRTMLALFGKSPFNLHLNHIMDYSFFWIMGMYDYYQYTGDAAFVGENLKKTFEVMDYTLSRTDQNGFVDSKTEDWVFVDWADLDNSGEVCFEQILMFVALKNCAELGEMFGEAEKAAAYRTLWAEKLKKLDVFWDEKQKAYIYSLKDGKSDEKILRYPNMFAVLYDVCAEERKEHIKESVLKNDRIPSIVTPYMKFYEFSALCKMGEQEYVLEEIRNYWGGMLKEGATTFWEAYDYRQQGREKYAMYGRKYGKSLCHAWGASPLYLIGKYIVGLTPADGEFILKPCLAGLDSFDAELPLARGSVKISMTKEKISVYSDDMYGTLELGRKKYRIEPQKRKEVDCS